MKNKKVISVLVVVVAMTLKGFNVIPEVFILPGILIFLTVCTHFLLKDINEHYNAS